MRQRIYYLFFIMLGVINIFQVKDKRYVTEEAFKNNVKKQIEMNKTLLQQLRKQNVTEEKQCKIEYFFYTDKQQKAAALYKGLIALGYTCSYKTSAGNEHEFVITGRTNKMQMSELKVSKWSEQMCKMGYKYDCDFDGWGTDDF